MVPTRRQWLAVSVSTALTGLGGCLSQVVDTPHDGETTTTTQGQCSPMAPPQPDTGEGLPEPRSYPEGPPEFTESTVKEFVEQYEHAYKYNAMLAAFVADRNCVKYLEIYVVGNETTIRETDHGVKTEVTTTGSYTGASCPTETGTDTPTPLPHVDLPNMTVQYHVTKQALERDGSVHECW